MFWNSLFKSLEILQTYPSRPYSDIPWKEELLRMMCKNAIDVRSDDETADRITDHQGANDNFALGVFSLPWRPHRET